jgi:hypothetical protein
LRGLPVFFSSKVTYYYVAIAFSLSLPTTKNPCKEFLIVDVSESSAYDGMWFALFGAYLLWSCSLSWHVLLTGLVAMFGVLSIGLDASQVLKGLLNNKLCAEGFCSDPPFVQRAALAHQGVCFLE